MGTLSGRLSRARDVLRGRLTRRGVGPSAALLGSVLDTHEANAAVPLALAASTAKAAAALAVGPIRGQVHSLGMSANALANDVMRSATIVKISMFATAALALAAVSVMAVSLTARPGAGFDQAAAPESVMQPGHSAKESDPKPSPPHRPADQIVKELDVCLKTSRRALPSAEFEATHSKIAALAEELAIYYPHDARVTRYLPERWSALNYINRKGQAIDEIDRTLKTSDDTGLKNHALFLKACLRLNESIDAFESLEVAKAFAIAAPGDNRAAELFYQSADQLDASFYSRISLAALLALIGILIVVFPRLGRLFSRSRLRLTFRIGVMVLAGVALLLGASRIAAPEAFESSIRLANAKLTDTAVWQRFAFIALMVVERVFTQLKLTATSWRFTVMVATAIAFAITITMFAVNFRRRAGSNGVARNSPVRLAICATAVGLAVCLTVDGALIAHDVRSIRARLVHDYPDSFRGRLVAGETRQSTRIGQPFELEFSDAISGRRISVRELRGKVVVVDFWATWCGPCVGEIRELKRLYRQYHKKGVEFIGVSHDLPEEDGGLEGAQNVRRSRANSMAAVLRAARRQQDYNRRSHERLFRILGN